MNLQAQLEILRRRMQVAAQRVDARMASRASVPRGRLEDVVEGCEIISPFGRHFESEQLYGGHRRHGNTEIGRLQTLPDDLLEGISEGEIGAAPPQSWAFLDTETTGLAGGSGTCAFLIGIGRITADGFRIRQFFMRDYAEEASQLRAVSEAMSDVTVLVTYNGKCFDVPLLETRFRMTRARPPFARLRHLDLLFGARRLWRLRMESCRLVDLENRILGYEREGDIPGHLIPEAYFEYVRNGRAARLAPVFQHNALDIVSLACLTGIVPQAFRDPNGTEIEHGADLVSMGRWLRQAGRLEQACALFRRAISKALRDDLLFRTLWDLAGIEKKLKNHEAALGILADLATCRNAHRVEAMVELAKFYEHRAKNYERALYYAESALDHGDTADLRRRHSRLLRKACSADSRLALSG